MKLIRSLAAAAIAFVVAVIMAGSATAVSPHFIRASGAINNDGALTVSFKEAGLGTNQNIDYLLTGTGTATWVCVNRGGKNPSAANKTTQSNPFAVPGTFNSGKNGQVTAAISTPTPSAGSFSCPNGQDLRLASVSYTDILLTDTTNGVSIPVGDVSSGCLLPNVRGACD